MRAQFPRVLRHSLTALEATVAVVIVTILFSHWHRHVVNLLAASWHSFLSLIGTTGPGFLSPIIVSALSIAATLVCIRLLQGKGAMHKHWWESAAITAVVTVLVLFIVYGPQFMWRFAATIYEDHRHFVELTRQLKQERKGLVNPKPLTDDIEALKRRIANYQRQESTAVRVYPLAPGDRNSGLPRMEYILASGKIRTPVTINIGCDFPISKVGFTVLTRTGGTAFIEKTQPISANAYRLLLLSPAWAPQSPLYVTVFFVPPVNQIPACSFEAE